MTQHLKPRSATKVIYQGDDFPRMAELGRALDAAKRKVAAVEEQSQSEVRRVGDDYESVTAAKAAETEAQSAFDAFVDEAAERALEVVLHAIGKRRFRDLVAEHPPREVDSEPDEDGKTRKLEHPDDRGYGVNTETFSRALLVYRDGDYRTIAQPEFESVRDLEDFVDDELSEGDFEDLWVAAYLLNRAPSSDPFA